MGPTASTTQTPPADDKELPTVDVAGVNLVGEIFLGDGSKTTTSRIDLIDEAASRISHSSQLNGNSQFTIPLSKISEAVLPVRIKEQDKFYFSDIRLPADIVAAVNKVRVKAGMEPLKNSPPPVADSVELGARKLVLVLPENGRLAAPTDENVVVGVAKQWIDAASLPNVNDLNGKTLSVWSVAKNRSGENFLRFGWRKTFDEASTVKLVVAKNEAELSHWNGQEDSMPVWPTKSPHEFVWKDFSRCSEPAESGRPAAGSLSASNAASCGFLTSEFPFSEGEEFFVRLTAETETEIKLSPVFRVSSKNRPPVIWGAGPDRLVVAKSNAKISFNMRDDDSPLSCSESVSVRSENIALLPNENISVSGIPSILGGTAACELSLTPSQVNLRGSSVVTVTVVDGAGSAAQKSFVYSSGWRQEAYIKAANGRIDDLFGTTVSLSGERLAVGAPREDTSVNVIINSGQLGQPLGQADIQSFGSNSGAVYVYRRSDAQSWSMESFIKPYFLNSGFNFGASLSLSGDTLAVGAIGDNLDVPSPPILSLPSSDPSSTSTVDPSGAVYVYRNTAGAWSPEAYIKASNAHAYDNFGSSVALSGDLLAVGVELQDSSQRTITEVTSNAFDQIVNDSGAVYVYRRVNGSWVMEAFIKGRFLSAGDRFGSDVSLSGETLAVGAPFDDSGVSTIVAGNDSLTTNISKTNSGAVYVFSRAGGQWSQEAYVKAANSREYAEFGAAVSLSDNTLAVGVPGEDHRTILSRPIVNGPDITEIDYNGAGGVANSGAVYVYQREAGIWRQQAFIKPLWAVAQQDGDPTSLVEDNFGFSVSLQGDLLAVGATGDDFMQSSITDGPISNSGSYLNSGSVRTFRRFAGKWYAEQYIKASNASALAMGDNTGANFGCSVSLSGDTLAVGAFGEDSNSTAITNGPTASVNREKPNSGAVYIYRN